MGFLLRLLSDPAALTDAQQKNVAQALTQAFREGGAILKLRGRAAIASALSSRFANGFAVKVYPTSGYSASPRIFGYHKIRYAGQFDNPETISGELWLPIEQNLPGGTHWTPKKYIKQGGKLVRGRNGSRFLFGQVSVGRSGKVVKRARPGSAVRKVWKPLFVLVRSVNDPKLLDMGSVGERVASDIASRFKVLNG